MIYFCQYKHNRKRKLLRSMINNSILNIMLFTGRANLALAVSILNRNCQKPFGLPFIYDKWTAFFRKQYKVKYTDQKCPNQQFSSTAFQFIHTISKYSAIYVNCTRFSTLAKTYQLHTMPILKNRFAMCSACCLKVKKTVSRFVRSFFGRIYGAPICFRFYLTFRNSLGIST